MSCMNTYAERLAWAMTCRGMDPKTDQSNLARMVGHGCKPQNIQHLLDPNKNAKASKYTPRIAEVLRCNANWLAFNNGAPPEPRDGEKPAVSVTAGNVSAASAYNPVTRGDNFGSGYEARARLYPEIPWEQAGDWMETYKDFDRESVDKWHECHIDLGKYGYVLSVKGDSMTAPPGVTPSFPEGIKLFVVADAKPIPGNFVIVQRGDNEPTFKKFVLIDGIPFLEALNPDWPNRYMKLGDTDRFCGVVKHAGFDL